MEIHVLTVNFPAVQVDDQLLQDVVRIGHLDGAAPTLNKVVRRGEHPPEVLGSDAEDEFVSLYWWIVLGIIGAFNGDITELGLLERIEKELTGIFDPHS